MGAVLTITNDCLHSFEILETKIFTPGQGICLQRLEPKNSLTFKFDHSLAYGSWYDIQIIGRTRYNSDIETIKYLKKGIYLTHGKTMKMSELTDEKHIDHGAIWECANCKKENFGSVAICEYCYTNKSQTIITAFSSIPLIGIPFSIADTILQCGKAAQSNKTDDNIDACVTTIFATIDVITAPLIVGSLAKIPAKVAAENGIKLTAKAIFSEAGKPLLKEFAKELGKDGVMTAVKMIKGVVKTIIKTVE